MATLFELPDGRSVEVVVAAGEHRAVLYDAPLTEQSAVIAIDGDPIVRLANLSRLQDVLRNAANWHTTRHVGPRISYVSTASDEELQWLVEELSDGFNINPTAPIRKQSQFIRTELGFHGLPRNVAGSACGACGETVQGLDNTILFCGTPVHDTCGDILATRLDTAWEYTDTLIGDTL